MTEIIPAIEENMVQQVLTDQQVRQEVTSQSHYWFFHTYFHHYITHKTADFQRDIFRLTEDEKVKNIVIIAFRGSGKSTIVNLSYPLWAILGRQKKKFVLLVGQTQHQARQHLKNIKREMESNDLLRKDLGPFKEDDEWSTSSLLIPKHDARIMAVSMEQSVRGIRHNQYRPDLIICDDIEDLSSVKTLEGRNKTFDWLTSEVIPAGDQSTRLVMIGNLLHEDSVIMRMKEKIRKREMSGKYKAYPVVRNKKSLWPGKYKNMQAIKTEEKRVGNDIAWQREFMLRIVPDDGQVVHKDWIQYYDELPKPNGADPDQGGISFRYCAIGVDLAISAKQTADYTAFVPAMVYLIGFDAYVYILPEIVNRRMDFSTSQETLKALAQTIHDSPKSVKMYIEGVGYQQAFIQEVKNQGYKTVDVQPRGDKRSRLSASSHYIKTGKVLFPKQGCERLIEQMTGFGVEKHDDMVDAFTTILNEVMKDPPRRHFMAFFGGDGDDSIHWF